MRLPIRVPLGDGGFANYQPGGPQMDIHSGARTCVASRALMVTRVLERGWRVVDVAHAADQKVKVIRRDIQIEIDKERRAKSLTIGFGAS